MDLTVSTVYCREDIEGFYGAFLSGKKTIRATRKVIGAVTLVVAILFWLLAAVILIAQICTGDLQAIASGLPIGAIIVLLGWFLYASGHARFRSKAAWKAYPNKGERLTFRFCLNEFVLTRPNSETTTSYQGIVRLCEDKERFYLFVSPQEAHVLPKRDFPPDSAASFRAFIVAVTGLRMECC